MNWVQNLLDDEAVFPNRIGQESKASIGSIDWNTAISRGSIPEEL
jgi:hypothetical protein